MFSLTKEEWDKIHKHLELIPFDKVVFEDSYIFIIYDGNHFTKFDFFDLDNIKMVDHGDI